MLINSIADTECLAKKIGENVEKGTVILLSGDLGAGKTTLTKGIAKALGITQMIKSPTYTIIREYNQGRLPLYHMDVYRVEYGMEELGLEEYFESEGVSIVEWGEMLGEEQPKDYLKIMIEKTSDEDSRIISFEVAGEKSQKLLEKINEKREKI